jgi:hypothetical protein
MALRPTTMQGAMHRPAGSVLPGPLESTTLHAGYVDQLFLLLLLTMGCVWAGGNLLLADTDVLLSSTRIAATCLGTACVLHVATRATGSLGWGLAITYGLLWLVSFARSDWVSAMLQAVMVIAGIYTLQHLRGTIRHLPQCVLPAGVAGIVILACERSYTSFDMMARIHAGDVEQDTLFHASIAAMIKNYGVVSTGLHGLVETTYHVLSHVLMAATSRLSGVSVIEVYGVANWVLFAPLLILCLTTMASLLGHDDESWPALPWSLAALMLAATPYLLSRWQSWDSLFVFVSESYLVSLGLFVAGLVVLHQRRFSSADIALLAILAALMSLSKASVGLIFTALCVARLALMPGTSRAQDLAACAMVVLVVGTVSMELARGNTGTIRIEPLHFVEKYSFLGRSIGSAREALAVGGLPPAKTGMLAVAAVASFLVLHYLWSWLVVALSCRRGGLPAMLGSPTVLLSLAAVAAGLPVALLLAIPGGSAFYFSNVALFVALPAVVALSAQTLRRALIAPVVLGLGAVAAAALMGWKGLTAYASRGWDNQPRRNSPLVETLTLARDTTPAGAILRPAPGDLNQNPVGRCSAKPFVFPAVSERSWVGVVVEGPSKCEFVNYGYSRYGLKDGQPPVTVPVLILPGMVIIERPHQRP